MPLEEITWERLVQSQGAVVFLLLSSTIFTLCYTRVRSGVLYKSKGTDGQALRKVPLLPYWFPFLGHFFALLANPVQFLEDSRCVEISP